MLFGLHNLPPTPLTRGFFSHLHLDLPLFTTLLLLATYGLIVLYSASDQDLDTVNRQLLRMGMAFGLMVSIAQFPPRWFRALSLPLFFFGVVLLVATLLIGDIGKGAQRWLDLRVMRFQPSEILKIATPMMAAWVMDQVRLPPRWYQLLATLILILIPVYLIYKQPDLGTAVLVLGAGVAVMFLAGISWQLLLGTLGGSIAIAPLVWRLLRPYQQQRLLTFIDPESDPLESGYHIIQATIAVGSGGLYGKGWLMGTQSHLEFLPERSTDFIFAVLAEEFGLTGILVLFGFYLFIILRGLQIATQAQDNYSRLLAGSITLAFFLYVIVNTGMVTGILPVVGVPLPLVSYGGTSLVTIMAGFGILMSIHTHRRWIPV